MKESVEHVGRSSSSVVIRINNKLDTISSSAPKCTIFKVHELLRRENKMAYEPEILAIGPYHRGTPRLQVMESRKLRCLKSSLDQLGESDASKYVEAMKCLEPEARQCYSESTNNMSEDDFVEMMLLDGCFIIQFMRQIIRYGPCEEGWITGSTIRDVLIFENQIPLFVLQKLFSLIRMSGREPIHFHEFASKALNKFLRMMFSYTIPNSVERSSRPSDAPHILGFLHELLLSLADSDDNTYTLLPSPANWNLQHAIKLCKAGLKFVVTRSSRRGQFDQCDRGIHDSPRTQEHILNITSIPSATKLHAAGVHFMSKKDNRNPFKISFNDGVMEIPTFSIDDFTEGWYRNLIAYEQHNQECGDGRVGLHAMFMDCLIDSPEDVALLRKYGIIGNDLGDDKAVSTIFNKLVNNVYSDPEFHAELFQEVNAYCRKRRHKWMAKLRRDYFNSPWALISFFAAVFLLLLTLTQTVVSILGVL